VSRSSASDAKQVGTDGTVDGLYGIGAGVSVAEGKGFWINSVKSGGPAEAAGVCKGDLLISIDGRRPSSLGTLRSLLLGPKGTAVDLGLQRRDGTDAKAQGGPVMWSQVEARVVRGGSSAGCAQGPVLGIGMGFKVSAGGGFVVSNVQHGGPAERAGVLSGDVICTYNGDALSNKPGSFLTGARPGACLCAIPFAARMRVDDLHVGWRAGMSGVAGAARRGGRHSR
jgi:C-terminal processing protease CtpA/Prc